MGSPRKRPEQSLRSPLEANYFPRDGAKESHRVVISHQEASKPRKHYNTVFAKKKFYLDLKPKNLSCPSVKQVVSDLKALGGTIEEFFSRDVTTIITDAPESKLRGFVNCSRSTMTKSAAPMATITTSNVAAGLTARPGTPSGIFAPSPCTSVSLPGAANSPWSPLSVEEFKKIPVPRSRAEAILDRARIVPSRGGRGGGPGSSASGADVIENAIRWGIAIWSLPKIMEWLENFKARCGSLKRAGGTHETPPNNSRAFVHTRSQSVDSALQTRTLTAPYIKFEVTNHMYKPVCQEFKKFPQLHFTGRPGSSPFTTPDNIKNKARKQQRERHAENRAAIQNQHRAMDQSVHVTKPQPVAAAVATPTVAAVVSRRHHQSGYCEICESPFTDLYDHLSSSVHQHRVAGDDLWAKLDVCINKVNQGQSEEEEFNPQFSF